MAFQLPHQSVPLSLEGPQGGASQERTPAEVGSPGAERDADSGPTPGELLRQGQLCQPRLERLNRGRDQAAFDYLARAKTLLEKFRPEQFLSFAGVRESDQGLFLRSIVRLDRDEPGSSTSEGEDPIKGFLLLIWNLGANLRRQHRSA
jgi:hypothetical protein